MFGGGRVRRKSVSSAINASPCAQANKVVMKRRVVEAQPSIASTSSSNSQFGGERMIKARRGLLQRESLEESALFAEGEDLSFSCKPFLL
jgi:serine/arginine repetitive matrix protein 2